ncbi:MAG TPA: glycosyltransferase, partial [Thermomicrobiales bacterium]|nr:glycosyltransferase [Thermomicrobiales bacterium]
AEGLAARGVEVAYLTLRQWPRAEPPAIPGIAVVAVGPPQPLYANGRRRIAPPMRFGVGVFRHLLRHGGDYDVVHAASFPFFPLLAAALLRPWRGYALVVDWWEVWSAAYWRSYLGPIRGRVGWLVQWLAARAPQHAVCYSRLHAGRLRALSGREMALTPDPSLIAMGEGSATEARGERREKRPRPAPLACRDGRGAGAEGKRHDVIRLVRSILPSAAICRQPAATPPFVLFAGRLIPDKNAAAIVPALARARRDAPALRAAIAGDGPERERIRRAIAAHGLDGAIDLPGFLPQSQFDALLAPATCLVLPSRREGYGLAVLEAAAAGVPSVVVAGPDNAAAEWIEEGVNGAIAPSAAAADLASAMLRVHAAGDALRVSTAAWFDRLRAHADQAPALEATLTLYRAAAGTRRARATGETE